MNITGSVILCGHKYPSKDDHLFNKRIGCVFIQAMKRVRTEQIQYTVAQYLKRRQYVDTEGALKGAKLSQSAEEMAANLTGEGRYHWREVTVESTEVVQGMWGRLG